VARLSDLSVGEAVSRVRRSENVVSPLASQSGFARSIGAERLSLLAEVRFSMTISISSEFIDLCREQVALLDRTLGASPIVVYLAEKLLGGDDGKLVPIVAEPKTSVLWDTDELPAIVETSDRDRRLRSAKPNISQPLVLESSMDGERQPSETPSESHRLVLPLMHENVVVGLLVTARQGQPWSDRDRETVDRIAHTIAIACLLEQRGQWMERNYRAQQQLQTQQHNLLHDWLHQFRNPLAALRIFGKLLTKRLKPDDERRQYADNILRESDRLQDLLQEFRQAIDTEPFAIAATVDLDADLDDASVSRPLLPATDERASVVDLHDVLAPLDLSARALASERSLDFHAAIPENLPCVRANRKALVEVATNLIDNALKYTPPGGRVRLDAGRFQHSTFGDGIAIAISDTGLGIPARDMEHLFERRFRGAQADSDIPGTGLGLAIARDLVRQMHGDIEAFSPPKHPWNTFDPSDNGTTLLVWLPLCSEQ